MSDVAIAHLAPSDKRWITTIANWYLKEWDTPIERTFSRLENQSREGVLFQLVATREDNIVATVGLCNHVNLTKTHEKYSHFMPWVALLYTDERHRKRGVGQLLLQEIDRKAVEMGLNLIYLYTFTAESLYAKCGWKEMGRVEYKGHDTVIMKKRLNQS